MGSWWSMCATTSRRLVHDYQDIHVGVLASSLAKRAPGYLSLGFPDPRERGLLRCSLTVIP